MPLWRTLLELLGGVMVATLFALAYVWLHSAIARIEAKDEVNKLHEELRRPENAPDHEAAGVQEFREFLDGMSRLHNEILRSGRPRHAERHAIE